MQSNNIVKLTKRYIVDFLNALFFSRAVAWDGDDQYNQIPLLTESEDLGQRDEQRGVLLVHKKYNHALRLLITVTEDTSQKVCYRITNLKEKLLLDDPKKVCNPMEIPHLDFVIADLNLGIQEASSYSFLDTGKETSSQRVFSLLSFLLESIPVIHQQENLFEDLLMETKSWPPYAGDAHYSPIYGVESD